MKKMILFKYNLNYKKFNKDKINNKIMLKEDIKNLKLLYLLKSENNHL